MNIYNGNSMSGQKFFSIDTLIVRGLTRFSSTLTNDYGEKMARIDKEYSVIEHFFTFPLFYYIIDQWNDS